MPSTMDTLALLCNLHADGPATLQRLRREGCESLDALLALEVPKLCQCLDWSEEFSQRFMREAVLLAERLGETVAWEISEEVIEEFEQGPDPESLREPEVVESHEAFEPGGGERDPYTVDELMGEAAEASDETQETLETNEEAEEDEYLIEEDYDPAHDELDEVEYEEEEYEEVEEEVVAAEAPAANPVSLAQVLGTWRDLDDSNPPLGPDESSDEHVAATADDEELRDYVVDPGEASPNRPLARVELPGLERKLVHRLAQLGIHSLGGLVEAPTTALARRLPMPFTRLRRLQFLARRELARTTPPAPTGGSGGLPTAGGPGATSAGPFA